MLKFTQAFKDKIMAKIAEDAAKPTLYEIRHVLGTPLYRVYVNGEKGQEFTSHYAATCYIEHRQKMDAKHKEMR